MVDRINGSYRLGLLNVSIQLTPVWCIALSYLESYGHYLTTDPAPTGGSSNHVTVNVDIW